jgi:hypothetical protein
MLTYHIDKTAKIVYLEGGDPSLDEWKETLLTLFADPDFEIGFNFLSDRRFLDRARSSTYVRAALDFLNLYADQLGTCKWATVVSTTAAYGMGRMSQILSEDMNIRIEVFTDKDEARNWLLRPEPE